MAINLNKMIFIFIEENGLEFFNGSNNDPNRFSQLSQQQQLQNQRSQQQQQHNNLHSSDNLGTMYANNLSKFFDFHKNQQQQQAQQQQFQQPPPPPQQQLFFPDQLNMSNLIDPPRPMDTRRLDSQYLEQPNTPNGKCRMFSFCFNRKLNLITQSFLGLGLLGSQHQHKQRMLNKFDQLGVNTSQAQQQQQSLNNSNLLHNSNNTQNSRLQSFFQQQQQQQQHQQQPPQPQHPQQSVSVDDELGKRIIKCNNFVKLIFFFY